MHHDSAESETFPPLLPRRSGGTKDSLKTPRLSSCPNKTRKKRKLDSIRSSFISFPLTTVHFRLLVTGRPAGTCPDPHAWRKRKISDGCLTSRNTSPPRNSASQVWSAKSTPKKKRTTSTDLFSSRTREREQTEGPTGAVACFLVDT